MKNNLENAIGFVDWNRGMRTPDLMVAYASAVKPDREKLIKLIPEPTTIGEKSEIGFDRGWCVGWNDCAGRTKNNITEYLQSSPKKKEEVLPNCPHCKDNNRVVKDCDNKGKHFCFNCESMF